MAEVLKNLQLDRDCLLRMMKQASMAGDETGVRVRDPQALVDSLSSAIAEIERWQKTTEHWRQEAGKMHSQIAGMRDVLSSIEVYGSDTLSGPPGGVGDRDWYRDGVREMRNRALAALPAPSSTTGEAA